MTDKDIKKMKHLFMLQHQLLIRLEEKLKVRHVSQELYDLIMEEDRQERLNSVNQHE